MSLCRYVSGGDPIPLGKSDYPAVSGTAQKPSYRSISEYSWSDCGDFVKIYVTQTDVVALANKSPKGSTFEGPDFCSSSRKSVEFRVRDPERPERAGWKFLIANLYKEIDGDGGKTWRVSDSKITITLKKVDTELKWYDLKAGN